MPQNAAKYGIDGSAIPVTSFVLSAILMSTSLALFSMSSFQTSVMIAVLTA
jgi:hypothetical protein